MVHEMNWDVSHSPMVGWDRIDIRIHTHTCGIWDRLGYFPLSHGMDIRIHTYMW